MTKVIIVNIALYACPATPACARAATCPYGAGAPCAPETKKRKEGVKTAKSTFEGKERARRGVVGRKNGAMRRVETRARVCEDEDAFCFEDEWMD